MTTANSICCEYRVRLAGHDGFRIVNGAMPILASPHRRQDARHTQGNYSRKVMEWAVYLGAHLDPPNLDPSNSVPLHLDRSNSAPLHLDRLWSYPLNHHPPTDRQFSLRSCVPRQKCHESQSSPS